MSALECPVRCDEQETRTALPEAVAASIEELRQERIEALTEQAHRVRMPVTPTRLETQVDDLLNALHDLHRLEQLAAYAARGGQITVEADRSLIAAHTETYQQMLERYAVQYPQVALVTSLLMPSTPRPLD